MDLSRKVSKYFHSKLPSSSDFSRESMKIGLDAFEIILVSDLVKTGDFVFDLDRKEGASDLDLIFDFCNSNLSLNDL
jgi:hypothetical protein